MPWIAFAYMSTMMYLVCTSAAFWFGGPAHPNMRPVVGICLNGASTGSTFHTGLSSQTLVGPQVKPCCETNHFSKMSFDDIQRMNFLAASWFLEYFISRLVNGPG